MTKRLYELLQLTGPAGQLSAAEFNELRAAVYAMDKTLQAYRFVYNRHVRNNDDETNMIQKWAPEVHETIEADQDSQDLTEELKHFP